MGVGYERPPPRNESLGLRVNTVIGCGTPGLRVLGVGSKNPTGELVLHGSGVVVGEGAYRSIPSRAGRPVPPSPMVKSIKWMPGSCAMAQL